MNQIIYLGLKIVMKILVAFVINKCVKIKRVFNAITENWVHAKCNGTTDNNCQQLMLEADDVPWSCISCIIKQRTEMFPFGFLSKLELRDLNGVDLPSFLSTVPSYDTQSNLTKMPNLGDFKIDENFVQSMNSKYLDVLDPLSYQLTRKVFYFFM